VKFFHFFFKLFLYRILVKIYYWIFRLKNNKSILSSPRQILQKKSAVFVVIFLFLLLVSFNIISPNQVNALENRIPHTIIANLITRGFNNPGEGDLIEESADINTLLASNKENHLDASPSLSKEDGLSPHKDVGNNNKPLLTENKDAIIKPKTIATDLDFSNGSTNRRKIIEYTVASGDTISSISKKFAVSVNTILWANNLRSASLIRPGNKLIILPYSGILYTVKNGDSLAKIARTYKVAAEKIIEYNNLGRFLKIGEKLMLPGANKIIITRRRSSSRYKSKNSFSSLSLKGLERVLRTERNKNKKNKYRDEYHRYTGISVIKDFIKYPNAHSTANKMLWPTVGHRITQYFSWHHPGIDIANKIGTPLYAADSGRVIFAGVSRGYGNNIVIDHGNGRKTRYAHASKLFVKVGNQVKRGQTIAAMGSSGWSTGPHVHFEVLINNQRRNPLNYTK